MLKSFIVLSLLIIHTNANAELKFRAREHFDIHKIKRNGQEIEYKGLSNTFNFGYEVKKDYYYALYFNPIIGNAKSSKKDASSYYGEKITLFMAGIEAKKSLGLADTFGRLGLGWAMLKNDPQDNPNGFNAYAALGYDWEVKDDFVLAPELAYRFTELGDDTSINSVSFSIGLHFYNFSIFEMFGTK